MPEKDNLLRTKTYKEDDLETERRVFYTLDDGKEAGLQAHRNSKAVAMLVKILREQDILDDDGIDAILLECINERWADRA